jgi:hypothetical protein
VDQFAEVFGGAAFFEAAELALSEAEPAGDAFLGQRGRMVRVGAVGMDERAHVPAVEGGAYLLVAPELGGYRRGR